MRRGKKSAGGGGAPWGPALKLVAWALAILAVGSAFAPMSPGLVRGLHLVLCVFSLLEAGIALGGGRRWAFFVYAAIAVVVNPIRPFTFAPQVWRLVHAGAGLWLAADHLP
ncbi:MAG: hypothetical protein DMD82_03740 [Candidatus Rokuibacteriota bacterium]|nr:MAG: hypothetical protein DMD82_03740 [Candidatus Rokubacteria bacterium]